MKTYEGNLLAQGLKIGIIAARFNEFITSKLVGGAIDGLVRHGMLEDDIELTWVPGAFEIPLAVLRAAKSRRYDAVVAIGAVIRGETAHFDHISREASHGLMRASMETGTAVGFGILTVDTDAQAMARSEPGSTNKGFEAAMAAIEMANLLKQF